jgi:signal peptidase I
MSWFGKRDRWKARAHELHRHARHYRRMNEDRMRPEERDRLLALEERLGSALAGEGREAVEGASTTLESWLLQNVKTRSHPGVRENLEILVVAVGVAMACRTYFIQPFKIPTGSMQPTLYGIQYRAQEHPTLMDRFPLKLVKWAVFGEWYLSIETKESGYVTSGPTHDPESSSLVSFVVNGRRCRVPTDAVRRLSVGDFVPKHTVLWSGLRVAGDHVFVDRTRWNFSRPRRGQIMVFNTTEIPTLPPKTHYIKRLVGLPGERVSIAPPALLINGEPVMEPEGIARIVRQELGNGGYQLIDRRTDSMPRSPGLRTPLDIVALKADEYFALGDNTRNSRDGRYWGPVPRANLVGPAVFVYWPVSRRWGAAR